VAYENTYLITGASSGIGIEVCRQLLLAQNRVIAVYRSSSQHLDNLRDLGDIDLIQHDFSSPGSTEAFINENAQLLSTVDGFIGLASTRRAINYGDISTQDFLDHFLVNTIPVALLIQHLSPLMEARKWGRIVIGSSIGVKFGGGEASYCYSISKLASELIPNKHKQWSKSNVLINSVRIGVTHTETMKSLNTRVLEARQNLIPMNRLAQPSEIAEAICWIAGPKNTFITGQTIPISGGE